MRDRPTHGDAAGLDALRDILRAAEGEASWTPSEDPAELARFIAFVRHHRIAGFIYRTLRAEALLDRLPDDAARELADWYAEQARIAEDRLAVARALDIAFDAAGLDVVFLKGAFLAQRYYPDWRDRFTWDTDVFVRGRTDLERARAVILADGYSERSRVAFGDRAMTRFTHDQEFEKEGVPLDLHWAFGNHFTFRVDYGKVWARRRRAELEGHTFFVLGREDELMLTVLGTLRDIERGRLRLKSCIDLLVMLRILDREIDWHRFFRDRREERLDSIFRGILSLALDLFEARDRFPAVASHLPAPRGDGSGAAIRRLRWSRYGLANKTWAYGLYRGGRLPSLGWWLLSQPIRRLTHA